MTTKDKEGSMLLIEEETITTKKKYYFSEEEKVENSSENSSESKNNKFELEEDIEEEEEKSETKKYESILVDKSLRAHIQAMKFKETEKELVVSTCGQSATFCVMFWGCIFFRFKVLIELFFSFFFSNKKKYINSTCCFDSYRCNYKI